MPFYLSKVKPEGKVGEKKENINDMIEIAKKHLIENANLSDKSDFRVDRINGLIDGVYSLLNYKYSNFCDSEFLKLLHSMSSMSDYKGHLTITWSFMYRKIWRDAIIFYWEMTDGCGNVTHEVDDPLARLWG